jgi:hypothetical protein
VNQKIKYEKPVARELGAVSPIAGLSDCRDGTQPTSRVCVYGNNPEWVYVCTATGAIADGNCDTSGMTAGQICRTVGSTPGWGHIKPAL